MKHVDANGLTEEEFLAQYDPRDFPRPSVTADIVVFASSSDQPSGELRILLIKRGGHPFMGHWALPGGFLNPDETVEAAARRELEEETGIRAENLKQLYAFSKPGRDPRTWVVTVAYIACVEYDPTQVVAGDDAVDAQWFAVASEEQDGLISLKLTSENELLTACLRQVPQSEEYEIIKNNGLAFDHAAIITCALAGIL